MFQTVHLSIIRSLSPYTQQLFTHMSFRFADSLRTGSGRKWFRPEPVAFYSKNKFEQLVYIVGFIIRIYHDARSHERQIFHKIAVILTNILVQI